MAVHYSWSIPDGIWYHSVDEEVLDRIVKRPFKNNEPVDEYIFHRLSNSAPALAEPVDEIPLAIA